MNTELIRKELIGEKILNEIIYFEELASTNEYAKKNRTESDTLIITSYQTDGKGRFNRQWKTTPEKDLTFSIVKSFKIAIDEIHLINFYSSFIILSTLKNYFRKSGEHEFLLKWPNDILLNGKKVAGLLLDVKDLNEEIKKFIVGIGLNVNGIIPDDELKAKATSLVSETQKETVIENLLIMVVKNFYENLSLLKNKNELMKSWTSHTKIIGKKISFRKLNDGAEQSVTVVDIDTDGGLKVISGEGKISKYYSGEISLNYL
jgi:BirA family biotin operon repressor/biotin-[acetyl-CoA-carboxylase] ligase